MVFFTILSSTHNTFSRLFCSYRKFRLNAPGCNVVAAGIFAGISNAMLDRIEMYNANPNQFAITILIKLSVE